MTATQAHELMHAIIDKDLAAIKRINKQVNKDKGNG